MAKLRIVRNYGAIISHRLTTRDLVLVEFAVSYVTFGFISIFLDVAPRVCAHSVACLGPTPRKLREVKRRTRSIDCNSDFLRSHGFEKTCAFRSRN